MGSLYPQYTLESSLRSLIIGLALLFASCSSATKEELVAVELVPELDTTNTEVKQAEVKYDIVPEQSNLHIEGIGSFNTLTMNVDSFHEYGAGDCGGTVRQLSYEHIALGIDSMDCEVYGYAYSHYLLSKSGSIQVAYLVESDRYLDEANSIALYIIRESIFDFNSDPQEYRVRIDTVTSLDITSVSKEFKTDTMTDPLTSYEHLEMEYLGNWAMEMDY